MKNKVINPLFTSIPAKQPPSTKPSAMTFKGISEKEFQEPCQPISFILLK